MSDQTYQRLDVSGLSPYLQVGDPGVRAASDFYQKAFVAEEMAYVPAEDGKRTMHCCLRINGSTVMMCDSFPDYGHAAETPAAVTLHIQVQDPQAWFDRAQAAGCEVLMPMDVQFWGDRYGQLKDPFGFHWSIGGPP
jgi:uncharacterized glyoxalase superfamily protein PhnB